MPSGMPSQRPSSHLLKAIGFPAGSIPELPRRQNRFLSALIVLPPKTAPPDRGLARAVPLPGPPQAGRSATAVAVHRRPQAIFEPRRDPLGLLDRRNPDPKPPHKAPRC